MKKWISLLVAFATIMSLMVIATPVSADEEGQNTVTALGNEAHFSNVPFSNGYNGFCLNDLLKAPKYGHEYTVADTSAAKRIDNGTDVSQLLKLLFIQCFEEIFIKTDQGYIMTEDEVTIDGITDRPTFAVQRLIYHYIGSKNYTYPYYFSARWKRTINAYDGPAIPDSGYQRTLENGDVITFYFTVMLSGDSATQNMFAYKFDVTPAGEVEPETVDATVKKVWDDANNQDETRPTSIVVKLFADGRDTGKTLVLNEENSWAGAFTGLAKKAAGDIIAYTVDEVNVPDGYEKSVGRAVETNTGIEITITNTLKPNDQEPSIPQTGDNTNLLLWFALLFVSAVGIVVTTVLGKKRFS